MTTKKATEQTEQAEQDTTTAAAVTVVVDHPTIQNVSHTIPASAVEEWREQGWKPRA